MFFVCRLDASVVQCVVLMFINCGVLLVFTELFLDVFVGVLAYDVVLGATPGFTLCVAHDIS